MQIVSIGNNMHEMPKPIFSENITNLSSAELAQKLAIEIHYSYSVRVISLSKCTLGALIQSIFSVFKVLSCFP